MHGGAFGAEAAQEFDERQHFADGNCVEPDGSAARRLKGVRQKAEALAEMREVPAVAQSPVK